MSSSLAVPAFRCPMQLAKKLWLKAISDHTTCTLRREREREREGKKDVSFSLWKVATFFLFVSSLITHNLKQSLQHLPPDSWRKGRGKGDWTLLDPKIKHCRWCFYRQTLKLVLVLLLRHWGSCQVNRLTQCLHPSEKMERFEGIERSPTS